MNGIPTYTRHTVAWPSLGLPRNIVEEVSISFDAKGGVSHGGFNLTWHDFSRVSPHQKAPAVQVECFADGLGALLERRMVLLLKQIGRHRANGDNGPSPDQVVEWLEEMGIGASQYHLRGLVEAGLTPDEKSDVERRLKELREHERGT